MNIFAQISTNSLAISLACCLAASSILAAKAEDQIATDAAKGRALTEKELNSIYEGQTWRGEDSASYFRALNRGFVAWVGKAEKAVYGEGSWAINDQGRLCFSATWHSLEGTGPSTTCFEHRTDDKNIYQRKLPDGNWYVFSHLPAQHDDAIQKLQPGDHVSEDFQENKRYLAEHKDQIGADAAKGHALTAKHLNSIYEDRTWPWENGAAYFAAPNRPFIVWINKGTKASFGEGSWSVSDQGRLCFRATWHTLAGTGPSTTCWENRSDDKKIYQRKLPDGKWYVFSHIPPLPDDAIGKLQPGDHVSENYQKNKHYLAEHARRKKRK